MTSQLYEGVMAHEYSNLSVQLEIQTQYKTRYLKKLDPNQNPVAFDPINPPNGWVYDPYYELWIERS